MVTEYPKEFRVILPPSLYDRIKAEGWDMQFYARQEFIPVEGSPWKRVN